jgi:hypothetical protein
MFRAKLNLCTDEQTMVWYINAASLIKKLKDIIKEKVNKK